MKTMDLGKVSITPRGPYSEGTTYHPLDLVQYNGSSFLVKQDATGITPAEGEYYTLLAQKGEMGPTGPKGDTGATGPRGATGASGTSWKFVHGAYTGDGELPSTSTTKGTCTKTITVSGLSSIECVYVWYGYRSVVESSTFYKLANHAFCSKAYSYSGMTVGSAVTEVLKTLGNQIIVSMPYCGYSDGRVEQMYPSLNESGKLYCYTAIGT